MSKKESAREIKEKLEKVFLSSLDTIERDLAELPPKERLDVLAKLIPYVLPKSEPLRKKKDEEDDLFSEVWR